MQNKDTESVIQNQVPIFWNPVFAGYDHTPPQVALFTLYLRNGNQTGRSTNAIFFFHVRMRCWPRQKRSDSVPAATTDSISRHRSTLLQLNCIDQIYTNYFHFFFFSERRRTPTCVGCGSQILDQFILRVAPDLEWHASCLKCADCNQYLDETCTCFVRDGKPYCKRDYTR